MPVDEKKAKRPFAFKLITPSKSMYFAATSDVDLDSWYSVFNEHCKGALGNTLTPSSFIPYISDIRSSLIHFTSVGIAPSTDTPKPKTFCLRLVSRKVVIPALAEWIKLDLI